jgi:hypothetical protein
MTQYLLSVHHDYSKPLFEESTDIRALIAAVDEFNKKITAAGEWVFGGGLEDPSTATVVDATHGTPITTDGPFAEAKERIGGFWVLELPNLDAALARAAEASAACGGPVEVRPFQGE